MKVFTAIIALTLTAPAAAFAYDGEPYPARERVSVKASIDQPQALNAYTLCAAADVATTSVGLSANVMHEINPLTKALGIKSLGPVAGTVVPLIALSVAGYFILRAIDRSAITAGAAALTCAASIRNGVIIGVAK